jgi:hypothetical protein
VLTNRALRFIDETKPVARGNKKPAYLIKEQRKEYEKESSRLLVNRVAYRRRDHRNYRRHRYPEPHGFTPRR